MLFPHPEAGKNKYIELSEKEHRGTDRFFVRQISVNRWQLLGTRITNKRILELRLLIQLSEYASV